MANPGDTQEQRTVLKEVMGAYRYEVTEFEAGVWLNIIDAVPKDRFIGFLRFHFQSSPFAPKPSDASKFLDPSINPDAAFQTLASAVSRVGPYEDPCIADPVLRQAVHLLGGWAVVNEQMPAPSEKYEMRAFRERFNTCFTSAIGQVRIEGVAEPEPLKTLLHADAARSLAALSFTQRPTS